MHSFEFTHENKSCSACAKDQHKHVTDTVTDTNKDTQVPSFCYVDIFIVYTTDPYHNSHAVAQTCLLYRCLLMIVTCLVLSGLWLHRRLDWIKSQPIYTLLSQSASRGSMKVR